MLASRALSRTERSSTLELISLFDTPITDLGCAKLVAALNGGTAPMLVMIFRLDHAPASNAAKQAVREALARAIARRS